jgi:hypothetical protein
MFAKTALVRHAWGAGAVVLFGIAAVVGACQTAPSEEDEAAQAALGSSRPCASSLSCPKGTQCTTELGVCNRPPGCDRPGAICPDVCYGTCDKPVVASACTTNADCRTFSDYCTGCDCRALSTSDPDPKCKGPGVQCFVDPCLNKTAVCEYGRCVLGGGFADR